MKVPFLHRTRVNLPAHGAMKPPPKTPVFVFITPIQLLKLLPDLAHLLSPDYQIDAADTMHCKAALTQYPLIATRVFFLN